MHSFELLTLHLILSFFLIIIKTVDPYLCCNKDLKHNSKAIMLQAVFLSNIKRLWTIRKCMYLGIFKHWRHTLEKNRSSLDLMFLCPASSGPHGRELSSITCPSTWYATLSQISIVATVLFLYHSPGNLRKSVFNWEAHHSGMYCLCEPSMQWNKKKKKKEIIQFLWVFSRWNHIFPV